jgi:hypothetical protein
VGLKTDYGIGDDVKSLKPQLFGLPGTVLSNNTDLAKPLSVILLNDLGTWQHAYNEVELISSAKPEKVKAVKVDKPVTGDKPKRGRPPGTAKKKLKQNDKLLKTIKK